MHTPRHLDAAAPPIEAELTMGSLIAVDGVEHLVLAAIADLVMLVSVATHHVYLVQDASGCIRLPNRSEIGGLLACRRAVVPEPKPASKATDAERMRIQLTMLDAAAVRNGVKAISIHLYRFWTPDMVAMFGPHDDPATIRRWRTEARRAGASNESSANGRS